MSSDLPFHRRSIRLQGYDYSQQGAYFVTVCTQMHLPLFGRIETRRGTKFCAPIGLTLAPTGVTLTEGGRFAQKCWLEIPKHFPNVILDEFVIMPNHVHGIIIIYDNHLTVGANNHSPLQNRPRGTSKTIGSIIRGFKIGVTKWFRKNTKIHDVWQRNYYEHVIRNEGSLNEIREYIRANPARTHENDINAMGE